MSVTTNDHHCWIVTLADGSPTGFEDSEPHYASEDEARKFAKDITYPNDPPPIVKRLDHLCSSATTVCGYRYDEDDEGVQHWPDGAEAFQAWLVENAEYRLGAEGELLCPAVHDCNECDAIVLRQHEAGLIA
ncbi:hypothetical protein Ade02nite_21230 [Paractinoplanes deccanensis]|uniref:Uncharacterized protein n=1 Tax=Paractinoplanes deccanensis TaxID=113561 RepID=A0ABQ3Y0H0_9ACTN|nr:hypothetical protein [Actinoplanes deccanensis]GID73482.1 hypothetical protein Ade02nite_21230 [Actinoplanes deccanensis]